MHKYLLEDLQISSPVFKHGGLIPQQYSCEGQHSNPPFKIEGIPDNAKTIALIMEDMDAPHGIADHWIIWNLTTGTTTEETKVKGTFCKNIFNNNTYLNASTLFGMHRYCFTLYVLDATMEADEHTGKEMLLQSMDQNIIAKTEMMGRYHKEYDYAQHVAVA